MRVAIQVHSLQDLEAVENLAARFGYNQNGLNRDMAKFVVFNKETAIYYCSDGKQSTEFSSDLYIDGGPWQQYIADKIPVLGWRYLILFLTNKLVITEAPMRLGNYEVEFFKDNSGIKVGCVYVSKEQINKIVAKLQSNSVS